MRCKAEFPGALPVGKRPLPLTAHRLTNLDLGLLRDFQRVVNLDPEITNRAFEPMARWP
jgi:hypothetical protein